MLQLARPGYRSRDLLLYLVQFYDIHIEALARASRDDEEVSDDDLASNDDGDNDNDNPDNHADSDSSSMSLEEAVAGYPSNVVEALATLFGVDIDHFFRPRGASSYSYQREGLASRQPPQKEAPNVPLMDI